LAENIGCRYRALASSAVKSDFYHFLSLQILYIFFKKLLFFALSILPKNPLVNS